MKYLITLALCYTIIGQEFIGFFGSAGGGTSNGLLDDIIWFTRLDAGAGVDDPEDVNCCLGASFTARQGTEGTAAGVVSTARTIGALGDALYLNYDYMGGGSSFTIAGWVYLGSLTGNQTILASWDESTPSQREFKLKFVDAVTDTFRLEMQLCCVPDTRVTVDFVPTAAITATTWYFICAGFDDTNDRIFASATVDGAGSINTDTTTATTGTMNTVSQLASFGLSLDLGSFWGSERLTVGSRIDHWGCWYGALSSTKKSALFAKTPYASFTH